MTSLRRDVLELRSAADVVQARHVSRRWAVEFGFTLVEQTKIVTAVSELARNTVEYGKGGTMTMEVLAENARTGLRLTFEDRGPGIADVDRAMQDGFTSGGGLGLGLGGAKRLMSEFEIRSTPGQGTTIVVTRWR
jgi:serine/threonine-protein kinase RsbT